ncbi:hypothetical protein [Streptomyces sp. G45]|uniref:hypothetical protein n=1 Tax=Streptomyces sp. G45 TaxID=3406627 RepID=UPI003C1B29E7
MTLHHDDPTPSESSTLEDRLRDRLRAWATDDLACIAVTMLIEERELLARPDVRRALVVLDDEALYADWAHLTVRLGDLDLDESEYAFMEVVLAIALGRQVLLGCVLPLGERRLAIVLRALAAWAGADSVAVGTRA